MQIRVGGEVSLRLALGGKMNEFRVYYERHLPHYQPSDGMLFITFRLAGSLPVHVIEQVYREAQFVEQQLRVLPRAYTGEMAGSMHFRHLASCQRMCILSPSRCVMDYVIKNPVNAGLVAEPKEWPYTYCVGRT